MSKSAPATRALESVGGAERLLTIARGHKDSSKYVEKNRTKLLRRYGNTWIVVHNCRVVAHGTLNDVAKKIETGKINSHEVQVAFISDQKGLVLF